MCKLITKRGKWFISSLRNVQWKFPLNPDFCDEHSPIVAGEAISSSSSETFVYTVSLLWVIGKKEEKSYVCPFIKKACKCVFTCLIATSSHCRLLPVEFDLLGARSKLAAMKRSRPEADLAGHGKLLAQIIIASLAWLYVPVVFW